MKLVCEIHTKDSSNTPSYRVYVNGELMTERDYVVPETEQGHYNFVCDLDLPAGENKLEVVGINHEFALGKMWLDRRKIIHNQGVFTL
jgi:hypothetical protein